MALFVGGAKLGLIHHWASDQPFFDQWSAEGGAVYRWRLGGAWEFAHYFFPHGEHTPALTRIIATGCAVANADQWDSRLQMLVSVGAHMLSAVLVWQLTGLILRGAWRWAAAAVAALLLAMPAASENFLWGFQTQFVFLIFFGLAHLLGTMREDRLGASWWLAQVCGFLVLFSIASGMLSAVALAGVAALRLWREPRSRWAWGTLLANAILAGCGVWLLHRAYFAAERTTGFSLHFFRSWGHLAAWPLPGPWLALLTQAPAWVLLWGARAVWDRPEKRSLVALIFWTSALAAAFAYGRGTEAGGIAVRYKDPLILGLIANAFALAFLVSAAPRRTWRNVVGAGWVVVIAVALAFENAPEKLRNDLEGQAEFFRHQQDVIAAYLVRNDPAELLRDPRVLQYLPHLDQTRGVLGDPLTRISLPASLAAPLAVQRDATRSSPGAIFRIVPGTPNNARVLTLRGGVAGATFVSQPIGDERYPIWRLRVSGQTGDGAGELELRDANDNVMLPLSGPIDAAGRWKTVHFARGHGPVRLFVHVPPGKELTVTEPLELAWLSWLLPKFTMLWSGLLAVGALLFVAGGLRDRHSAAS